MKRPLLTVGRRVRQWHVLHALDGVGVPTSVLDAGCGDGRLLATLAERWRNARLVGIDPDAAALEQARARLKRTQGVELLRCAICEPIGEDQFDLVVCIDVIEHVREDRAAIGWLASRVSPGGNLLLHVPASPQRHLFRSINRQLETEVAHGGGPHVRVGYEPARLTALVEDAGLVVESIGWTFHGLMTRLAEDVDTWLHQHRAKAIKVLALPLLLSAAATERSPADAPPGYGLLMTARRVVR